MSDDPERPAGGASSGFWVDPSPASGTIPTQNRARLFVAVVPPPWVLDRIERLPRMIDPGVRWTRREQWHVTLRFLGHTEVQPVVDALAGVELPAADAVLGPQVGRLGRRVLMVPVGGLDELAGSVLAATAELGKPPEDRPFLGHLTLARIERVPACGLTEPIVSARWPVSEVALVRSTLLRSGAVYEVVRSFPCR